MLKSFQCRFLHYKGLGLLNAIMYTLAMHVQSYPSSYNDPAWENIFLSLDDAEVGKACQAWFEQWCDVKDLFPQGSKPFFECMPALHALSNRTTANIDAFLNNLDDEELSQKPGYIWARSLLTAAVAAYGWEGFAMRCWTDARAYAGFMQHIEREGLFAHVDDLAFHPHAGKALKGALDLYAADIAYPWIGAACIRWALFGKNTMVEELPQSVQWLKNLYYQRHTKDYWSARDVLETDMDFGAHAPVIKVLLQSPDVWRHMYLQEGKHSKQGFDTSWLWIHWAKSVGFERPQALALWEDQDMLGLCNCILQGSATDLAMMRLGTPYECLLTQALHEGKNLEGPLPLPDLLDPSP